MRLKFLLTLLLFIFWPHMAAAYSNPGQPTGFVNDYANLLNPATKQTLEQELSAFENTTKHEIVVAIVNDLGGDTIENFAVKLFEGWKIGKGSSDNGVLFLIAKDDKKMRLEIGYGLEGILTDAQSAAIINKIVKPAFQAGAYDQGVTEAARAVEDIVRGEDISGRLAQVDTREAPRGLFNAVIYGFFAVIFFGNFLAHLFGRSKAWWPGGIWGAILGVVIGIWIFGLAWKILETVVGLGLLGLGLDYWASKKGPGKRGPGHPGAGFFGGFGGGGFGGGGFGGFGGGRSGGGGSSGGW